MRTYSTGVLFDAIFLTLFFLTWLLLGALPWLAISLRRRAFGALWALPFALLGGAGGGVAVPLLGLDTATGVGLSMPAALAGGGLLTLLAYRVWDDYGLAGRFARFAIAGALTSPPPRPRSETADAGREAAPPIDSEPQTPPAPGEG